MTYTIKDDRGNMICSIENIDPVRSNESLPGIAAFGIVAASIILPILGINGISSAIFKSKLKKVSNFLGKEKMDFFQNYLKTTDDEVLNIIKKSFNKNKSLFPQMTKFYTYNEYNSGSTENRSLMNKIFKNKITSEKTFEFEYVIDAYYKYADLKKMGIEWDDNKSVEENLDIQLEYDDKLDRMHDKAIKSLNKWFKNSVNDIKTPMKLNSGCEITQVYINKNNFFGDDVDAQNCEYTAGYPIYVILKHSPKFINEILNPIKEAIKNKEV